MARVIALRATTCLVGAMLCGWPGWQIHRAAMAQGIVAGPPPVGQPMWMRQPDTLQVGANGAVNLDQPVMMAPNGMGPVMVAPMQTMYPGDAESCAAPQPAGQYFMQPYPGQSAWIVPPQQMQYVAPVIPPQPCPQPVAQILPPAPPPRRWSIFGEALYLHPTGVDVAHAQQQSGAVPFGLVGVADPSFDIGFRLGGEMLVAPMDAVFASYAFYEVSTDDLLSPSGVPGETVASLVHHPGTLTGPDGPVSATYDIEFQVGDLAYRKFLVNDNCQKLSAFVGGRYGHLEQRFMQQSEDVFIPPGQMINTTTSIDFDGGGPMAGIDAEHRLGVSRFSVYGRTLVAALTGQFEARYLMETTPGVRLAEANWQDDRIVPMLDYELGLAWTSSQGRFRLAAGYMANHWFNAVTTPVFIDAVQADNYTDVSDTISFDGLVGRAELRW